MIASPDVVPLVGPKVVWKGRGLYIGRTDVGRRHGTRNRLLVAFGSTFEDDTMRIGHEAIYQALYVQGSRSVAPRIDGLLAHLSGAADAEGAYT